MEVSVPIPFQQLVDIVRQLPPSQKAKLQKVLEEDTAPAPKASRLTELLLTGTLFTDKQIEAIEDNRKSINQWRKKPL